MDKHTDPSSSISSSENENQLSPEASSFVAMYIAPQWQLFLVLGVAGLIVAGSLNVYLWRYNRMLNVQQRQQVEQLRFLQQNELTLNSLIQDTINFSVQYPDVRPILTKYIGTLPSPPASIAPPAPPATTTDSPKKKGS